MLDSDLPPDPMLLTDAARRATELGDPALATRFARAAVAAGGDFEPRLLLGNALAWSGRGAEADTELAVLSALARTDAQRAQAAFPQVATLFWRLGRPTETEKVLDAAASVLSNAAAGLELVGLRSVLDALLGRTDQAAQTAAGVLAHPRCSPPAAYLADWGLAVACGGAGPPRRGERELGTDRRPRRVVRDRAAPSGCCRIILAAGAAYGRPAGPGRAHLAAISRALPGHPRPRGCDHQLYVRGRGDILRTGPDCGARVPPSHRSHPARSTPAAGHFACLWDSPARSGWPVTRLPHAKPLAR